MSDNKYEEIPYTIYLREKLKKLMRKQKDNFYGEDHKRDIIEGIKMAIEVIDEVDHEMKIWSLCKEGYDEIQS